MIRGSTLHLHCSLVNSPPHIQTLGNCPRTLHSCHPSILLHLHKEDHSRRHRFDNKSNHNPTVDPHNQDSHQQSNFLGSSHHQRSRLPPHHHNAHLEYNLHHQGYSLHNLNWGCFSPCYTHHHPRSWRRMICDSNCHHNQTYN